MIGLVALLLAVPLNARSTAPNVMSDANALHTPKVLRTTFLQTHGDTPLAKRRPWSRSRGLQSAMRAQANRRPHSLLEKRHSASLLSHNSEKEDAEVPDQCRGKKYEWGMKMMKKCSKSFGSKSTWTYSQWNGGKPRRYCQTGYKKCATHRYVQCCTRPEGTTNLNTYCKVLGLENKRADDPACKVQPILEPMKPIVRCLARLADCLGSTTTCDAEMSRACMNAQGHKTTMTTTIAAVPSPALAAEDDADDDADGSEGTPAIPTSTASNNLPTPGSDAGTRGPVPGSGPVAGNSIPRPVDPSGATNVAGAPPPTSVEPGAATVNSAPPAPQITGTPVSMAAGPAAGPAAGIPTGLPSAPAPAGAMVSGTMCPRGPSVIPPTQEEVCSRFNALLNDLYSQIDALKLDDISKRGDSDLYTYVQKLDIMGAQVLKFKDKAMCGKTGADGQIIPPIASWGPKPSTELHHGEPPAQASLSPIPQWVPMPRGVLSKGEPPAQASLSPGNASTGQEPSGVLNKPPANAALSPRNAYEDERLGDGEKSLQDEDAYNKEGREATDGGSDIETAGEDKESDQGNATEDDEDEADDDSDSEDGVVAVDQTHITQVITFLGEDFIESVDDVQTKVQPFNLKWWRYRWEHSAFEGLVLTPAVVLWYVFQRIFVRILANADNVDTTWRPPETKLQFHQITNAFGMQALTIVQGIFVNWMANQFPDPSHNLYDIVDPAFKYLFSPECPFGLQQENLPFVGTSYYDSVGSIFMHVLAGLACWFIYVIIICKQFQFRIRGFNKHEDEQHDRRPTRGLRKTHSRGLSRYDKLEDVFMDKTEAWLEKLEKESHPLASEAKANLIALGMKFDSIAQHTSEERSAFAFNQYLEHALIEASQTLIVPQAGSIVALAGLGVFVAVYCYKSHREFAFFYKYIAGATVLVFLFAKFVAWRLEKHTFPEGPSGEPSEDSQDPMPAVTPRRILTALQMLAYVLCYSTTRVLFAPEMWHHHLAFTIAVLVFFLVTLGLVWRPGSNMLVGAIIMLAVPPHLRPEDLSRYAKGYTQSK